jgi:hypothetical protein
MSKQDFLLSSDNKAWMIAFAVGGAGLLAGLAGYFSNHKLFFFAYLVAYLFWLAIAMGGMFSVLIHHLVGADWSIVMRRIPETLMYSIPILAVLFIPIALGIHSLYEWSHPEVVAADKILQHKSVWLNEGFFLIRAVIYFSIWFGIAYLLYTNSTKQDDDPKNEAYNKRMETISAPGMILFALSVTFAAFDWIMSLDPHFFSTIFGVYFFAGSWWSCLAFVLLATRYIRNHSALGDVMNVEHYHDIAKLMTGFTVFWTYIGFSQFMLIWYANIPEETIWYKHRWEGAWVPFSLFLFFGHFVLPFLTLVFRSVKRSMTIMPFVACWFLVMEFIDMYWLVMPCYTLGETGDAAHHLNFSWMHIALWLGIGGIFVGTFFWQLTRKAVVPVGDPRLEASIHFRNA